MLCGREAFHMAYGIGSLIPDQTWVTRAVPDHLRDEYHMHYFTSKKNSKHTYLATVRALCLVSMNLATFERSGKIMSILMSKSNAWCIWQNSKRFIWNWISTSTCKSGFSFMSLQHLNIQLSLHRSVLKQLRTCQWTQSENYSTINTQANTIISMAIF